jgi:hypothetical protein
MDKAKIAGEIKAYCTELVSKHSRRDEIAAGIENEYLMHKTPEDQALLDGAIQRALETGSRQSP